MRWSMVIVQGIRSVHIHIVIAVHRGGMCMGRSHPVDGRKHHHTGEDDHEPLGDCYADRACHGTVPAGETARKRIGIQCSSGPEGAPNTSHPLPDNSYDHGMLPAEPGAAIPARGFRSTSHDGYDCTCRVHCIPGMVPCGRRSEFLVMQ